MSNANVTLAPVLQPPEMPRKQHRQPADGDNKPDAYAALVSMHADEPYLPLTEAALRCHAKRRLFRALIQAANKPIAEWLFADPANLFHQAPPLNNSHFENSLAIRATQVCSSPNSASSSSGAASAAAASSPHLSVRRSHGPSVRPGDDILLVAARASGGRVLGYSFGGLSRQSEGNRTCPIGDNMSPFPPHVVGRFSFDSATSDLVVVVHGLLRGCIAILHIRGAQNSAERERNIFLVPPGNYGFQRLPGRLLTNLRAPERRLASMPRFQFSSGGGSAGGEARAALSVLERVVKGKFESPRLCRDNFDENSGEVLTRQMRRVEAEFDARDAIGMQVLRDLAVRTYFSFMSSARGTSSRGHSHGASGSSSGRRP